MAGDTKKIIREVGAEAAALLAEIHRESFPMYWDLTAFNDFFNIPQTRALMIGEGAMIVFRQSGEQADIITLAVRPNHRRQGFARKLVLAALEELKASRAEQIFLDVEVGNSPAIKLYESIGFLVQRRRKLYYRQKDGSYTDALVMSKKIA
ncbi:MAG: GNAT family N-acetyltransferase [Rickettsiales bacterium]|nr:GNAT family N-acetyltransferase [Rickettsiales bacterium]